jgi:hypothetical protein
VVLAVVLVGGAACSKKNDSGAAAKSSTTTASSSDSGSTGGSAIDKFCDKVTKYADEIAQLKKSPQNQETLDKVRNIATDLGTSGREAAKEVISNPSASGKLTDCTQKASQIIQQAATGG